MDRKRNESDENSFLSTDPLRRPSVEISPSFFQNPERSTYPGASNDPDDHPNYFRRPWKSLDDKYLTRFSIPRQSVLSGTSTSTGFDVNVYQQKKTLAQGMMDLALISANANQLRYVLQSKDHPFYYLSVFMIFASLLLQIFVGIGLIWNSRYNVKDHSHMYNANRSNNLTVIAIFLVTILNVFICSFGVSQVSVMAYSRKVQTTMDSSTSTNISGLYHHKNFSNFNG